LFEIEWVRLTVYMFVENKYFLVHRKLSFNKKQLNVNGLKKIMKLCKIFIEELFDFWL
jgi:hypothetical protein